MAVDVDMPRAHFRKGEISKSLVWEKARELGQQEYENLPEPERHYVDVFNHGKILSDAQNRKDT